MTLGQMRTAALLLAIGVAGSLTGRAPAEGKVADAALADYVAGRINAWQPTAEERRFDQIGWAPDIRQALRLGRDHHRPVFLFTHDGRINIGRC
jgi:hypothetical protein